MGAFSIWHLIIFLVVVILVFGTKKLSGAGKDLGEAVRGFKEGIKTGDAPKLEADKLDSAANQRERERDQTK